MLAASISTDRYDQTIEKAITYVEEHGYEELRARHDEYDEPAALRLQGSDTVFRPDITARLRGGKYYFDISNRQEDPTKIVGKWKLMSTLAKMKQGRLKIFVPYGSMKYTNTILEQKAIDADVIKLSK